MAHHYRRASTSDLPAINQIIENAIMTWALPERVKRLSLPGYRYDSADLREMEIWLAEDTRGIHGVIAWEEAPPETHPNGAAALLVHGLYTQPTEQGQGIGTGLLRLAEQAAKERGYAGILIKAQAGAKTFFQHRGYRELPQTDTGAQYPHLYWKPC